LAKIANIGVPLVLKQIVDHLDAQQAGVVHCLPVRCLLAYGALKLGNALFSELRDVLFARVRYRAMRRLTVRTLAHLARFIPALSPGAQNRGHQPRSGAGRAQPEHLAELSGVQHSAGGDGISAGGGVCLLGRYPPVFHPDRLRQRRRLCRFHLAITNWRMEHRLLMNRLESQAGNEAVDSLINYETVKYFGNEDWELRRCDATLAAWENSAVLSQTSMSALNFGQGAIIAVGVTLIMFFAATGKLPAGR
jgi:hypothetical protein